MNRFALLGSWVLGLGSAPLAAQGIGTSPSWEVAGSIGAGFRAERGHTLGGARFGAALRKPLGSGDRWLDLGLGYAQITAYFGATGDSVNVKENSIELSGLGEMNLVGSGKIRLKGALGPVVSMSMGCTSGGDFAAGSAGYGASACTNDFAEKSNVRFGGAARLTTEIHGARAAFTFGAESAVNTIASGAGLGYAVFIGFRAALR